MTTQIPANILEEQLSQKDYYPIKAAETCGANIETFQRAVANHLNLEFCSNPLEVVDRELHKSIDLEFFRDSNEVPLRLEDFTLSLLTVDPLNYNRFTEIELRSSFIIKPVLTTPELLEKLQEEIFERNRVLNASASKISREMMKKFSGSSELSIEDLEKSTEAEPVVRLSRLILDESVALNASDIHIEPLNSGAVVRFRIDGMLKKHMDLEPWLYAPLTSRLKIMAGMDIAEKRISQDGRIHYSGNGEQFDLRVSTLPTHLGEKTVIRILKQDFSFLTINKIGLPEKAKSDLIDIINKPQGLFLVTGPTGSGKSSTLFAALNAIKDKEINITTIENPVEYKISGINQVQINEKAGVTFAATLRSILRQDPDVILIGETRDRETAEIALQSSQTGHLVFSTLHTNDSVAAITRLRDLGIPGYLIASSLAGVMAQRLVRKLCPHCLEMVEPSESVKTIWERTVGDFPFEMIPHSKGCDKCKESGYSGRMPLFELFVITDEIRTIITEGHSEMELRRRLHKRGYITLIDHGIDMIKEGKTSLNEVLRVVAISDGQE